MLGFNKTITIFNKTVSKSTAETVWRKTVLRNCFYGSKATTKGNGGVKLTDYATICKIPMSESLNRIEHISVKPGDLIVCGEVTENITGAEPFRENDIRKLYDGRCFIVKSVSDRAWANIIPHYIASEV